MTLYYITFLLGVLYTALGVMAFHRIFVPFINNGDGRRKFPVVEDFDISSLLISSLVYLPITILLLIVLIGYEAYTAVRLVSDPISNLFFLLFSLAKKKSFPSIRKDLVVGDKIRIKSSEYTDQNKITGSLARIDFISKNKQDYYIVHLHNRYKLLREEIQLISGERIRCRKK